METSKIVGDIIGIEKINTDDRLLEIVSPLQGCSEKEMEKRGWNHFTEDLFARGGETMKDVVHRLKNFYFEKARVHEGQHIVVVSHGEPMMITYLLGSGIVPTYNAIHTAPYLPTGSAMEFTVDPEIKTLHLIRVF